MKKTIVDLITAAAQKAHASGALPSGDFPRVEIEAPKIETHGDFATNFAMLSARIQKMAPRQIAQAVIDHLEDTRGILNRVEIAGPGFINFFVEPEAWAPMVNDVLDQNSRYGATDIGKGKKIQVEFVSANPTGPLHVGHGRGAAVGDSVANILSFCGYDVQREYYINDSGRQIQTLGRSVYLRSLESLGRKVEFPDDCYQGDYIKALARQVIDAKGEGFITDNEERALAFCARFAADAIINDIRNDLGAFGVEFDEWFSEQTLYDTHQVEQALENLKNRDMVYLNDGAWWFKSSAFGDEKDRVVVRRNGQTTYFASDIAYHHNKFQRGFDRVIDVWGADHHGYIPRMTAAVQAGGQERDQFEVILVQLVNLLRDGQPVAMSTRAGEFETLKDVVDEVGRDAARFIFLTRDYESPLDFDLEVAKQKTNDNPVYYVQYVHARIASIFRKAADRGIAPAVPSPDFRAPLTEPEEIHLFKAMQRFGEVLQSSAENLAPHRVTYYLMNLASLFHTFYNKHRVLSEDTELTQARLRLVMAVQTVIRNGLTLLGVSAPEKM
ncbi:MAG: arginine--tRNA ligase [Desulfobacteraceae bacterium]